MIAEHMKKIMEVVGIEGHYQSHSLRKTTATHLFKQGVDPQLIQEQKWQKSNTILLQKKSNLEMKNIVSDMLNVQDFQDREKVMKANKIATVSGSQTSFSQNRCNYWSESKEWQFKGRSQIWSYNDGKPQITVDTKKVLLYMSL